MKEVYWLVTLEIVHLWVVILYCLMESLTLTIAKGLFWDALEREEKNNSNIERLYSLSQSSKTLDDSNVAC